MITTTQIKNKNKACSNFNWFWLPFFGTHRTRSYKFVCKLYLLLVHCLFERFVNMYLFSMFVNNHTCALVLLFRNVCYQTCDILPFCNLFFSCGEITCVWVLNLCLIYRFLQQLTRSRTVYCITRCEKIIEHTGTPTPVNIIYYIVAFLQYEYTSKEIIISLIRSWLLLLLLYCFLFIWIDRDYFLLQAWPKLAYLWTHEWFIIWWIYWLKIKHIYIFII
jgi:hypothetical protein